jgi:protein-L-isoaspartate(D-aspartate) O-methyltransferase
MARESVAPRGRRRRGPRRRGGLALFAALAAVVGLAACRGDSRSESGSGERAARESAARESAARERMVRETIEARGVRDSLVLRAMRAVPRHLFVPELERPLAYADHPLPIGEGQTISQPYIVAAMTELLALQPGENVLEIGTGSGYQAAVLAEITGRVYSIEIVESLARSAEARLAELGYGDRVHVRAGDGYRGWPEEAPFDAIIVTAAPDHVPAPLIDQLAPGGRLVIPVGDAFQMLKVIARAGDGTVTERSVLPVRFVPMTGEAERGR